MMVSLSISILLMIKKKYEIVGVDLVIRFNVDVYKRSSPNKYG